MQLPLNHLQVFQALLRGFRIGDAMVFIFYIVSIVCIAVLMLTTRKGEKGQLLLTIPNTNSKLRILWIISLIEVIIFGLYLNYNFIYSFIGHR